MADDYLKSLDAQAVMQSVAEYLEAREAFQACAAQCDYSADYYCAEHARDMERAAERFIEHMADLLEKVKR